jgi:plastocyanin
MPGALALLLVATVGTRSAETWQVSIQDFVFAPSTIEIQAGDTVTWTQRDSEGHTTTSDTGVWSSPLLFPSQTFSHTFTQPGSYPYHCVPHPQMRGTVNVLPASSGNVSVALAHPEPGTSLTVPGSVRLEATVEAGEMEIVHVEFFSNETALGLAPKSPYALFVNLAEGEHTLTAVATTGSGETTASDPVQVTVIQPDPATASGQVADEGGTLAVSWSGGAGPFVIQGTPRLGPPDWETEAVLAERNHSVSLAGDTGFFRIADAAQHQGIPFSLHMTGDAERPNPVTTGASGSGLMRLDGDILTFNVRYQGLSGLATAAHIHGPAPAAEAAGVLIDLAPFNGDGFGTEGALSGQVILSPEQKALVLRGQTYVNVHTQQNPSGEIRGQIAPALHQIRLTGAKERPDPVDTPANGFGTLLLVGNQLSFHLDYQSLSAAATAAHIHGPADSETAAGVLIGLGDHAAGGFGTAGTLQGTVSLTPAQLAWLIDGLCYINLHTPDHPPGEIRGQIVPLLLGTPLSAVLSGPAERPDPVATDAVGSGLFRLEGNLLTFNVSYEGLSGVATAAHIHGPASAHTAAGVLINLAPHNGGAFGTSGILSGTVELTEPQRAQVLNGMTYVNLHTEQHPGGEIRGQIVPILHRIMLNGANERPDPVNSPGSGFGTLLLVGENLTFHLDYRDLNQAATASHIHGPATPDEGAGVLVDLSSHAPNGFGVSGTLLGTLTLAPDHLAWLIDGLTYINIHTPPHAPGEIRGQIER